MDRPTVTDRQTVNRLIDRSVRIIPLLIIMIKDESRVQAAKTPPATTL